MDERDGHKGRSRVLTGVMVGYVIVGALILLVPLVFVLVFIGLSSLS